MLSNLTLSPVLKEVGWYNAIGVLLVLFILWSVYRFNGDDGGPPRLRETIPFLSNLVDMARDTGAFWNRALKTMQSLDTEILRFRLGRRQFYLVMGDKKTNVLFRPNTGLVKHQSTIRLSKVMFGPTKKDMARLAADVSGRNKEPLPGTEHVDERLWITWHHIFAENLSRAQPTGDIAAMFFDNFTARIRELIPEVGKPADLLVWKFVRRHQTECAGRALSGDLIFDTNPDLLDAMADYELAILPIAFGPPRWLNPRPHRARDRWLSMTRRFMAEALETYDWDSPEAKSATAWEPVLGSPLIRSLARWLLDAGFDVQTIAGACGQQIPNQNSNTVPATAWCIMDALMCPDPELLPNLRREAEALVVVDSETGKRALDVQKLQGNSSSPTPWHQAVYAETLRLRSGLPITRHAVRDTEIDGFPVPKGSMVQAPVPIAALSAVWDVEGHPAEEFWPRRHLTASQTADGVKTVEFALGSRSGYWFPYGGGIGICPGRHFAKQEIIGTLALLLAQFDFEVVGWVMPDGESRSDRGARNGNGFAVYQPDRDLKVRMTRRW
ncbi:cytochrome P450 [Apodospora peruviana]|uniref:Cytochrome P450 n=1 Tax=Apodospora peruviana TaxID=516989 RepID=A0AAE0IRK7_9PEZI|nr:cytochrome P450 [Apodospora peruviana]